jgi:protein-disulfide isomerase
MRPADIAYALIAGLAALAGAAEAATREQAERAAFCMVAPDVIERSLALQPEIAAFESSARFARRGDGAVEIIEFFDYSCPACRALHPELKRLAEINPDVRIEIVDYPIYARTAISQLTGNKTLNASLIGLAALDQSNERALAFHDALMGLPGRVTEPRIRQAASIAGVDLAAAEARAREAEIQKAPVDNIEYAKRLGISGTPGLVVDGIVLRLGPQTGEELGCLVAEASRAAAGAHGYH